MLQKSFVSDKSSRTVAVNHKLSADLSKAFYAENISDDKKGKKREAMDYYYYFFEIFSSRPS